MESNNNDVYEETDEPIHLWFGLSYANYFVMPRSVLQSMPTEWQRKFVNLINEIPNKLPIEDLPEYRINAIDSKTKKFKQDNYSNYERGRIRIDTKLQEARIDDNK